MRLSIGVPACNQRDVPAAEAGRRGGRAIPPSSSPKCST